MRCEGHTELGMLDLINIIFVKIKEYILSQKNNLRDIFLNKFLVNPK